MSREDKPFRRKSALLSFRFLATAVVGSVLMGLVAAFGPQNAQLAVLGCFISVVGGLFLAYLGQEDTREQRRNATVESLGVPLALAADPELFRLYRALCDGLTAIARQSDPLLRDAALEKFVSVTDQIGGLAQGKVTFALTEGWRTLYERLLKTPGLREYRSVAWVRSADYWQDAPGRQSMRVNFEAAEDGLLIERIVLLRDELWPAGELLPLPAIFPWVKEQHNHGLRVLVVRESELAREPTRLYLDTAKLGRLVPAARQASECFARLAADEGGSPFFDAFLTAGAGDWPPDVCDRYPGLAGWRGVAGLKDRLRRLTGVHSDLPVLIAHRSAQLMTLASRLMFGPCRNVLVTDLGWPGWHAILTETASRRERQVTVATVRDGVLRHGWDEDEVVGVIRECYRRSGCDGLFLSAVSNLGVRLPVGRIAREVAVVREPWFVAVDGSQELNHLPTDLGGEHCDLYLAGCHKWLGAAHPLALAVYGRAKSREMIDTRLAALTEAGVIDDPLLRFTTRVQSGLSEPAAETVALLPLFTAHGAVEDASACPAVKLIDPSNLAALAEDAGWSPLLPSRTLRSSILLLEATDPNVRASSPERVREHFGRHGVALTSYSGGIVRLSLLSGGLREGHEETLQTSLKSAFI